MFIRLVSNLKQSLLLPALLRSIGILDMYHQAKVLTYNFSHWFLPLSTMLLRFICCVQQTFFFFYGRQPSTQEAEARVSQV